MARILEHHAKVLMKRMGLAVPEGRVCNSGEEVLKGAQELGGKVVVKAHVPVGGRGKVGAVKFAATPDEALACAESLFGTYIKGWPCREVLVERFVQAEEEYYASVTFDTRTRGPVAIVGVQGGISVEEKAASLQKLPINILRGLTGFAARDLWERSGVRGRALRAAGEVLVNLYRLFRKFDAKLIEINPLLKTAEGEFIAADAVLVVDDESLKKHSELANAAEYGVENFGRPPTERELEMIRIDQLDPYRGTARFVEFGEGDIGFMCGGGGGSLVMMDTLIKYGGKPRNYTEMGGNPTERKLEGLAKTVLSQPGIRGFLRVGNISSNTQVNLVAKALVKAVQDLGIDTKKVPMVVRAAGLNEDEGRKILEEAGISYFGEEFTMVQAAKKLLELMKASREGVER